MILFSKRAVLVPPSLRAPHLELLVLEITRLHRALREPGQPVFSPALLYLRRGRSPYRQWSAPRGRGPVRALSTPFQRKPCLPLLGAGRWRSARLHQTEGSPIYFQEGAPLTRAFGEKNKNTNHHPKCTCYFPSGVRNWIVSGVSGKCSRWAGFGARLPTGSGERRKRLGTGNQPA